MASSFPMVGSEGPSLNTCGVAQPDRTAKAMTVRPWTTNWPIFGLCVAALISALLGSAGCALGAEPGEVTLTLADAVAIGLRNNLNIQSAYLQRIADKFNLRVATTNLHQNSF